MKHSSIILGAALLLFGAAGQTASAQDKPVRFAFITDNHYSIGSASIQNLRDCIDDINSLDSLDFVILGGDLTDFGSDEEIAGVKSELDKLKYKYYVVAGNHDAKWSESGCNTFKNVFGYEQFEFEAGGWRFLGSGCGPDMRMAPALLPKESMVWLENLEPGKKSIFINHYPQDTSVLNYFDVTRVLKKKDVRFEIGGHWHQNRVLNYDGLPAVLGRSALAAGGVPGYNIFEIKDDHITASERRIYKHSTVQLQPWYELDLEPVSDTVHYDAHGIPDSYPWMKYDVNDTYPCVKDIWQIQDNGNIVAGFAKKGNTAYYTTSTGSLRAISVKDGRRLWSRDFPGKIFSTPAVDGKYLVFGCTDGYIYAVNAKNGRQIWKSKADKSVLASPVIFDGKVFIGASDGKFRALSLKDGSPVWTFDGVEGFVECKAYVDEKQVVFGSWGNALYSLDTKTGELQWIWKIKKASRMLSPAAVWPVKSAGRIFVAVPDRKTYAIDAATGEELFHVDGGREAVGLSEDGSIVYVKTMYNTAFAFRADVDFKGGELPSGLQLWRVEDRSGYEIAPTPIVEKNGMVILPTDKGNLLTLSAADGSFLWAHKYSVALVNPLEVWEENGKVFILASTMDGTVTLSQVDTNL